MPSSISLALFSLHSQLTLLLPSHYLKLHQEIPFSSSSFLRSSTDLKSLLVTPGFTGSISSASSKLISLCSCSHFCGSTVSVMNSLNDHDPNGRTWNLMMKSYLDLGRPGEALILYTKMRKMGVEHDVFTFPIVNRAVLLLKPDVVVGEAVHGVAMKMGFGPEVYFCNTMIEVYTKYGFVCYARKLFDEMRQRDLVSWTSLISGYVFQGNVGGAFELFNEMRMEMEPNFVTLIVLLQGCCAGAGLVEGKQLHGYVIKNGSLVDGSLQNSVLRMYTKMGCAEEVDKFFTVMDKRDVVSWNTFMNFYSLRRDVAEVVGRFIQMLGEVGPSSEALTSIVSMLLKGGKLMDGEMVHCFSIKVGLCDDILLTSLLDLYAKRGNLRDSDQLFREISCRSRITWRAMMSGYIQNGCSEKAISLFCEMRATGIEPGAELLGSLVDAVAHLGALKLGKGIHGHLVRNYKEEDMHLNTCILNMYIRCGNISSARAVFDRMVIKDIVTWTSMIEGYGIHGQGIEALNLYRRMLEEGVTPNSVTFLSLVSACSHSGLVIQGCEVFFSMKWEFGMEPDLDHYTCMVDLLGRSGKLKEALTLITKMMAFPDSRLWGALVAACRIHGEGKIGKFAARKLLELEPDNAGYYTLLSNIQASTGQWSAVEEVRRSMRDQDLKKAPGWSYIEEEGGRNYCFVSGDKSHKQEKEIYQVLGQLSR